MPHCNFFVLKGQDDELVCFYAGRDQTLYSAKRVTWSLFWLDLFLNDSYHGKKFEGSYFVTEAEIT